MIKNNSRPYHLVPWLKKVLRSCKEYDGYLKSIKGHKEIYVFMCEECRIKESALTQSFSNSNQASINKIID